uniref:Uncharacterized protein n=1 Tax=Siphoviridae sp. ctHip2 TaxID=2827830 RepID=A0A8S5RW49_9CAUD|nr:MAG TPA: hypothetical protein [Siphoviridae sp. ctHip2]
MFLFYCRTDFNGRYIVISETLKQLKLIFDKTINNQEKQLRTAMSVR